MPSTVGSAGSGKADRRLQAQGVRMLARNCHNPEGGRESASPHLGTEPPMESTRAQVPGRGGLKCLDPRPSGPFSPHRLQDREMDRGGLSDGWEDDSLTSDGSQVGAAELDPDPRVRCADCAHARGESCAAHPRSGLPAGVIGGLEKLLQHCPAYETRTRAQPSPGKAAAGGDS